MIMCQKYEEMEDFISYIRYIPSNELVVARQTLNAKLNIYHIEP